MIKHLIIPLLIITTLFAQQNRLFWDGRDWHKIEKNVSHHPETVYRIKSAYLTGVLDGRLNGYLKVWAQDQNLADNVFDETVDFLTIRELIKNINYFYEDPLNLYIPVPSAVIIANMYAEQMPIRMIDEYIRETRQWINDLTLDLDSLNYSKLLEDKYIKYQEKRLNRSE